MTTSQSGAGTKGVPRADRERQILAAATTEFGRRGYEGASLAAIAQQVGVTKTLLHQYFGSKQDLYLACLAPVGERLIGAMRTAMAESGSPLDAPLAVLRAVFTALEGSREGWFVLYDSTQPPDGEAALAARDYRAAIDRLAAAGSAEVLRAAGPAGTAAGRPLDALDPLDADALKYAWRGLVTGLVHWWIRHPEQSPDAMAQRCARLFATAGSVFGRPPADA
ncbi:TetR/AcrR family transcriptional regulator [Kitasatospora sp. NPDC094015]|uniref:TetR/AcrR family transcriptional regulator n=1 Tax=Kitasatospora sp. NPDC094015 TaxID=3155205 RepID=UPI00332CA2AA